jgi:hypothetical protein
MGPCVWANSLLAYPSEALKYIQRRDGEERFSLKEKKDTSKDFTKGPKLDPREMIKVLILAASFNHVVPLTVSPAIIHVQNKAMPIVLKDISLSQTAKP